MVYRKSLTQQEGHITIFHFKCNKWDKYMLFWHGWDKFTERMGFIAEIPSVSQPAALPFSQEGQAQLKRPGWGHVRLHGEDPHKFGKGMFNICQVIKVFTDEHIHVRSVEDEM